MPFYSFSCGHDRRLSYAEYDLFHKAGFPQCDDCEEMSEPVATNKPSLYGLTRFSDPAFRDAKAATGEDITSTKQIDALERKGVIRAITNPSTYKFKNGKNLKK